MSTSSTPIITSVHNQKVKDLVALKDKKVRDQRQIFLIENEHLILEALHQNRLVELLVCDDYRGSVDFNNKTQISRNVADKLSQTKSKSSLFGVCSISESQLQGSRFLLCDDVQDPGNLGTLIRSAVSFGFDGVIVSDESADFYNDKCIRSSQGALFYINLIRGDLKKYIKTIKQQGIQVIGTDVHQAKPLSVMSAQSCAIVVGNEGAGMSPNIQSMCDQLVMIETVAFESLNVAVAGSILMYHFSK